MHLFRSIGEVVMVTVIFRLTVADSYLFYGETGNGSLIFCIDNAGRFFLGFMSYESTIHCDALSIWTQSFDRTFCRQQYTFHSKALTMLIINMDLYKNTGKAQILTS